MMRFASALLAGVLAFAAAGQSQAAAVTDCPLRDMPFSADSPLVDLLLSPAARSVAEKELGTKFDGMPSFFGTQPPTFAAIVSLREAAALGGRSDPAALARADTALRRLSVTAADRTARCARYDNDRPRFVLPAGKPRLLLFEKINGFKDGPSVAAAHALFLDLAREKGWAIVTTDRGGAINPATLRQFDAVIWNNISGDVLTLAQRRAFRSYVEGGGAFVGVHGSAGDPVHYWDWYADTLIGARFAGHPMAPQFQDARVALETSVPAVTEGLPSEWSMNDEWYSFRSSPRLKGVKVIATLDERSYSPRGGAKQDLSMGDHPIAWTNCVGRGRMFYSAIGHRPETYSDPRYRLLLSNAISWAADRGACGK